MISTRRFLLLSALLLSATLPACSWFEDDEKTPLPGERISILDMQSGLEPADPKLQAEGFVPPEVWANDYWPQNGGYPNHAMHNPALTNGPLKKIWSADIGSGTTDQLPLTAQPVVFGGKIFTLDSESRVSAFNATNGKKLWDRNVKPKEEDEEVIGGGIAFADNQIFVTNGYREIVALSAADGKTAWRAMITSPSRAAPTIIGDTVYVLTVDNRLLALEAASGKKKWEYEGLAETASLVGAASPAANTEIVVAPLSSGELTALRVENGSVAWSENLASMASHGGASSLPDIHGLPVIDKDLVIAASFGGKLMAIEQRTGKPVWQRDIGSSKSPWISGNMIFILTENAELAAIGRSSGALLWAKPVDTYYGKEKPEHVHNVLLWNGPVFAGGYVYLTGPEGEVFRIDPNTGEKKGQFDIGSPVAVSPLIAGQTLFLLGQDGTLSAWR